MLATKPSIGLGWRFLSCLECAWGVMVLLLCTNRREDHPNNTPSMCTNLITWNQCGIHIFSCGETAANKRRECAPLLCTLVRGGPTPRGFFEQQ